MHYMKKDCRGAFYYFMCASSSFAVSVSVVDWGAGTPKEKKLKQESTF